METLTSLRNPKVMAWRSLKDKKGREEHRAFLVEGARMVNEALSSSFPVQAVLLREDYSTDLSLPAGVPVFLPSADFVPVPGDHCLLIFCDFCIDGWFDTGQPVLPPSPRMHDLSDAFAIVGFRPKTLSGGTNP